MAITSVGQIAGSVSRGYVEGAVVETGVLAVLENSSVLVRNVCQAKKESRSFSGFASAGLFIFSNCSFLGIFCRR